MEYLDIPFSVPIVVSFIGPVKRLTKDVVGCGHSILMGRIKHSWQDREYVLAWFSDKEVRARKYYRQYAKEGISHGRRPELVVSGLIRSLGGWSQVLSIRRNNQRVLTDERILGLVDFVDRILNEADERLKYQMAGNKLARSLSEYAKKKISIHMNCRWVVVEGAFLRSGHR